jgi:hypothetical protein
VNTWLIDGVTVKPGDTVEAVLEFTDGALKQLGFESASEFYRMVADVDLTSTERIAVFKRWQEHDGTKQGLMRLAADTEAKTNG